MSVEIIIKDLLPCVSYTNEKLLSQKVKDKLLVYYQTYYSTGKLKTDKFQPAKAIVPYTLKITDNVAISIGLYFGDGQKSIKSKSYQAIRFANSQSQLNEIFLEVLESFGVKKEHLNVYLRISKNLSNQRQECMDFWAEKLDIAPNRFYKLGWDTPKHAHSKYAPYGTASIIYNNSSFRIVFDAVYRRILLLALKDNELAKNVLQGIIASDGNVFFHGNQRQISIAAKFSKDREYIRKLFLLMGIKPNKDCLTSGHESITVTGYSNLKLAYDLGLCNVHPDKKKKLDNAVTSYKNVCYRKEVGAKKIISLLNRKEYSVHDLAKTLNRTDNAIRRHLYIFDKKGLVRRVAKKRTAKTGRSAEVWQLK